MCIRDRNAPLGGSFSVGSLVITYPGFKGHGDYKLTENGVAPRHTDIVHIISQLTNVDNFDAVVEFLNAVYTNGLDATNTPLFNQAFKEKIFWITLQEEINYPQPRFKGRRLTFQRFFEASLTHTNIISIEDVLKRTNNHGKTAPTLLDNVPTIPSFYY